MPKKQPRLREDLDSLSALVTQVSEALGIAPAFVEKDFWVTELLRAVSSGDAIEVSGARETVEVVFKGGTSLSKVFGLIDRFSEDVDILVVFPDGAGVGSRDKALKRIAETACTHLGLAVEACTVQESTRGVKRNVRYAYPRRLHSAVTREYLLLEMGSRGGPDPHEQHQLRSMVAEYAINELGENEDTWEEFADVSIQTLAPERTLVEKLALLHNLGTRFSDGDSTAIEYMGKAGRHFYDVHQLLSDQDIRDRLQALGTDGVLKLSEDVNARSKAAGWRYVDRPEGGYAASAAFDPQAPGSSVAARSFQTAMGMVYRDPPTFEECLKSVSRFQNLL